MSKARSQVRQEVMHITIMKIDAPEDASNLILLGFPSSEDVVKHHLGPDQMHVAVLILNLIEPIAQPFLFEEGAEINSASHDQAPPSMLQR